MMTGPDVDIAALEGELDRVQGKLAGLQYVGVRERERGRERERESEREGEIKFVCVNDTACPRRG